MRELIIDRIIEIVESAGGMITQKAILILLKVEDIPEFDLNYLKSALRMSNDEDVLEAYNLLNLNHNEWSLYYGSEFDELVQEENEQIEAFRNSLKESLYDHV